MRYLKHYIKVPSYIKEYSFHTFPTFNSFYLKPLVSQSKFSGTRKFTLRYQWAWISFDQEISRGCICCTVCHICSICSYRLTLAEKWNPPYQTGKTVHVHAKHYKHKDRHTAPGVCGNGSVPLSHSGTSLRE